ncbi:MAG: hypothetical protein K6C36_01800 [Clostridia bacterium]|nr:hypothetical protein [Clostridia bacterium]
MEFSFLSAFFPERCCFCGGVIRPREFVCEECREKHALRTKTVKCPYCALPRYDCSCTRAHYYDLLLSPYVYDGDVRRCVIRYKSGGEKQLYKGIADIMSQYIGFELDASKIDVITSVPTTPARLKSRGFDQTALIAAELAGKLNLPYEPLLRKFSDDVPQKQLDPVSRTGNVRGTIDLLGGVSVEDRTVLLVDDIVTTGATLDECAATLKIFGANNVVAAAFAVSGYRPERAEKYAKKQLPPETRELLRQERIPFFS